MDQQEGMSSNRAPLFKGNDYAFWSIRMKSYLMALGCDVWLSVVNGYTAPTTAPSDVAAKKLCNDNSRVVNAILGGLENPIFVKVMHCKSTKEIWDKLKVIYEGDGKVKQAKIQTYRGKFESLKMKEEENIAEYFQRVDEIVNSIRALGEEIKDKIIVQKVLRSLPMRYDAKVSTLEDREDLDKLTMDELHGILIAYEMRTEQEKSSKRETTFKASKETKNHEHVPNENHSDISDEEEANFIRKLKKGSGKYKGKLPLKCFNCGKVGHFSSKCPYPKQEESDDEETQNHKEYKKRKTGNKKKFYKKKKNFYSKEDNSSSDMSEDDETKLLFMGIETQNNVVDDNEENSEVEGEVYLEGELISALEELRKYKKKNKSLREQLLEHEEKQKSREKEVLITIKESEQIIIDLKTQLQEAKRIEEVISKQLNEKQLDCEKLEAEIVFLKRELEKGNNQSRFENSSKILDDILNSQISSSNKSGLGYDQKKSNKGSNSTSQKTDKNPKSYAVSLQSSFKKEERKIKIDSNQHKSALPSKENEYRKNTTTRRTPPKRYQHLFLGYCFSCNNFGHKALHCRAYGQYNHKNVQRYGYKNNKNNNNQENKNYNSFSPLQNYNVECHKCNNYGHKSSDCRLPKLPIKTSKIQEEKHKKAWKEKQMEEKETECKVALYAKDKRSQWYVDSGCSKHMTGDQDKFLSLKKKEKGSVTFGDNVSAKILGKGTISLGNNKAKEENVLLVENLKPNLLSVSQTCDQGHILIFDSQKCEIRKEDSGKLVVVAPRTPSNVYILNIEEEEKCCMSQIDESWLWHRRMGHIGFDNLIKVNKKEVVRDMPKIIKPSNSVCRHCQHGKKTRVRFKTKEYSTSKPLELVHTDLCGPTRTKSMQGEHYFILFIDDYTRMTWVSFLKEKSESIQKIQSLQSTC
jgi:hypothetical protein